MLSGGMGFTEKYRTLLLPRAFERICGKGTLEEPWNPENMVLSSTYSTTFESFEAIDAFCLGEASF